MQYYTAQIIINNSPRTILVCKSPEPVTFSDPSYHRYVTETENQVTTSTYVTEPYIYRQAYDNQYYYYWFILIRMETVMSVTNEEKIQTLSADVEQLETEFATKDLDNKMAIAEVYELLLGGMTV